MDIVWAAKTSLSSPSTKLKVTKEHKSPAPFLESGQTLQCNLHSKAPHRIRLRLECHLKSNSCLLSPPSLSSFLHFLASFFWEFILNKSPTHKSSSQCPMENLIPGKASNWFYICLPTLALQVFNILIQTDIHGELLWGRPQRKLRSTRALPSVASCLKWRQALGWPRRSSRWYSSLLLGTVLRFFSCLTGISGCITTIQRMKEVSCTWKNQERSSNTENESSRGERLCLHYFLLSLSPTPHGKTFDE